MRPGASSAAAAKYRGVAVQTSSPGQLLVMLYDGVLRFVGEAHDALAKRDRARVGERIGKALAILEELSATLDRDKAPELADNLLSLYVFCRQHLLEANLQQDAARLEEVARTILPLREAFAVAAGAPPLAPKEVETTTP